MGLTLAKCPACGAELNLETDKDYFYCPHCGSKVLRNEEQIVVEHVVRTVDEAKVKREETIRAKVEAKAEAKRKEMERQAEALKFFPILIVSIVAILAMTVVPMYKLSPLIIIALIAILGLLVYKNFKDSGKK